MESEHKDLKDLSQHLLDLAKEQESIAHAESGAMIDPTPRLKVADRIKEEAKNIKLLTPSD